MSQDRMTQTSDKELKNYHFGVDSRILYYVQWVQRCIYHLQKPNTEYNRAWNRYVKSTNCIIDANMKPILSIRYTGYNQYEIEIRNYLKLK